MWVGGSTLHRDINCVGLAPDLPDGIMARGRTTCAPHLLCVHLQHQLSNLIPLDQIRRFSILLIGSSDTILFSTAQLPLNYLLNFFGKGVFLYCRFSFPFLRKSLRFGLAAVFIQILERPFCLNLLGNVQVNL